jgi:hypothetical protein
MRARRLQGLLALLLVGCSPEPTLQVQGDGSTVLCVGQRASLRVVHGDPDDSQLELSTFVLTDAAKRTLRSPSTPGLEVAALSPWEVGFAVPAGVAPGPGTLAVGTRRGPVFSAGLSIERVIAVRDATGKVWLTSLSGADGAITGFGELTPAQAGAGSGRLAIGPSGRLLAIAGAELRLATLERPPRISGALSLPAATRDLAISARNETLIANDQALLLAERPLSIDEKTPPRLAAKAVLDRPTLAVAVDRSGLRGVALAIEGATPARYEIVLLDLQVTPPAVLTRIPLPWAVDVAATLDLALAPDGGGVVVVNSAQPKVAILLAGASTPTELALPQGLSAPVSVAATRASGQFQIALRGSRGLVALKLEGGGAFDAPLDPALPSESGAPVAVAASENDETVLLLERELYLIPAAAKGRALKPASGLFVDKTKAEPGVSLAIQP